MKNYHSRYIGFHNYILNKPNLTKYVYKIGPAQKGIAISCFQNNYSQLHAQVPKFMNLPCTLSLTVKGRYMGIHGCQAILI